MSLSVARGLLVGHLRSSQVLLELGSVSYKPSNHRLSLIGWCVGIAQVDARGFTVDVEHTVVNTDGVGSGVTRS